MSCQHYPSNISPETCDQLSSNEDLVVSPFLAQWQWSWPTYACRSAVIREAGFLVVIQFLNRKEKLKLVICFSKWFFYHPIQYFHDYLLYSEHNERPGAAVGSLETIEKIFVIFAPANLGLSAKADVKVLREGILTGNWSRRDWETCDSAGCVAALCWLSLGLYPCKLFCTFGKKPWLQQR